MSIEIKLDTNALASLIEKDEQFRLKIQQCVLENIARRFVKGVDSDIQSAVSKAAETEKSKIVESFGSYQSGNWSRTITLKQTLKDEIKTAVCKASNVEIESLIASSIEAQMKAAEATIALRVKSEVDRLVKIAIASEVKTKVDAALAQIKF
jgi:hypothetical protein